MSMRWPALICVILLSGGCHAPPLQEIDQTVSNIVAHPFDVAPARARKPVDPGTPASDATSPSGAPSPDVPRTRPLPVEAPPPAADGPASVGTRARDAFHSPRTDSRIIQDVFYSARLEPLQPRPGQPVQKFELKIPAAIPGSETPDLTLPIERDRGQRPLPGFFHHFPPYPTSQCRWRARTVARIPWQTSTSSLPPTIRRCARPSPMSKRPAASSNKAVTYPNPTIGYETNPNNNNTGSATLGFFIDQVVKTGGKLTLAGAAAKMNLINAELALKRARSDLATTIRGDYFTLLVAKETVRVNKDLAHFADEIFRLQADLMGEASPPVTSRPRCGPRPSSSDWRTNRPSPTTSMRGNSLSRTSD